MYISDLLTIKLLHRIRKNIKRNSDISIMRIIIYLSDTNDIHLTFLIDLRSTIDGSFSYLYIISNVSFNLNQYDMCHAFVLVQKFMFRPTAGNFSGLDNSWNSFYYSAILPLRRYLAVGNVFVCIISQVLPILRIQR